MIICICGPTGVGKTKASIALAKKYKAIIINCDAMQVYKGLDIGTAKIKEEEKEGVPHYLFDIKEINEDYSVFNYQKDVRKLLNENKDQNIILVGGSGLYMKAALYDYVFAQENSDNDFSNYSNAELYDLCLKKDAKMTIHPNNRQRLIRFLNKTTTTNNKNKLLYPNVLFIGLTTNRDNLYNIINARVDKMFAEGLLEEVKSFYEKKINSKAINTAIGYKELYEYFAGKITLEEAKEKIKQKSRRYAKRQYTWYNNQMNINWFDVDFNNFNNTIKDIEKYIENNK